MDRKRKQVESRSLLSSIEARGEWTEVENIIKEIQDSNFKNEIYKVHRLYQTEAVVSAAGLVQNDTRAAKTGITVYTIRSDDGEIQLIC